MNRTLEWINKARNIHGDKYDYSKVVYHKATEKVCIVCPKHGEFWQLPYNHLNGSGCPECKKEKIHNIKNKGADNFIAEAKMIHGDKYDYSKVVYVDRETDVCIICPEHGKFWQRPSSHLKGCGCCKCSGNENGTTESFIEKARNIHGNRYDYSKVEYVNNKTKVCIICPEHGEFWQTPKNHLKGQGCVKCKYKKHSESLKLTTEQFVEKARLLHGDRYDYSKTDYVDNKTKLTITCSKHGDFYQTAHEHLQGCGCPVCGYTMSRGEIEITDYLRTLGNFDIITRNKNVISPYELDIFVPEIKLAIEFDGLIFHSELYNKDNNYHINKTNACNEKGIRLIHIFEDEWNCNKELVKSMLKNIVKNNSEKVYARKCEIKKVKSQDARKFLEENHLQGKCYCPVSYGLYNEGKLVSLMVFGKTRQQAKYNERYNETYELLRFCSLRNTNVVGGASKILKQFINDYKPYEIITYADKRWSEGNLYDKIGFTHTHDSKPNYFYVFGKKRENRFKYRKGNLVKQGFDSSKSEHQIMLERKIYRIYDCGTKAYSMKPNYL